MVASRMVENLYEHKPVLLTEVLEYLLVQPEGIFIDATFGRGGHTKAILEKLGPKGRLIAMDKDPSAVVFAKEYFKDDARFTICHGSFAQLSSFIAKENLIGKVNGILFDLGVSSPQLDDASRGFSFTRDGKLDMRMDNSKGMDAASFLETVEEKDLADILWQFGEEKFSRRIARAIVIARQQNKITTTAELAGIIAKAIPFWQKGKHPATRSFQAIRIVINQELQDLSKGLEQAIEVLAAKGRLLVISFHSLEDRLVKHFMHHEECGNEIPSRLPIKKIETKTRFKRIGRAIKPSEKEIAMNARARSAILRIGEKLK